MKRQKRTRTAWQNRQFRFVIVCPYAHSRESNEFFIESFKGKKLKKNIYLTQPKINATNFLRCFFLSFFEYALIGVCLFV